MSEYKRQIASGATVAVVVAFVLALGVGTLFPGAATSESLTTPATSGTMTSSLPSSTASTASSPSSVPTSGTSSSTAVSSTGPTTSSTTTTLQTTYSTTSASSTSTGTTSMTVTESTTTTVTFTTTSTTTTCGTCGILKIESANLTVGAEGNRTILSLTLVNAGNESISNVTVSLGSTAVVVIPLLAAGAQTWVSIQVPSSQLIQAGQPYEVTVQGGYGSYSVGASTTVEASG